MLLARFLNQIFKKDGFILIDADKRSILLVNLKKENRLQLSY